LSGLTLRTAAETLLGAKGEQEVADLCVAARVVTDEIAARFYTFPLFGRMRYRQCVRPLDRIVGRMIRERRSGVKHTGDLLSMLAHAQDGTVQAMSDQQLRDEAVTLLLAGNETTAVALSWTCYLLGQHAAIDERVARELEEVLDGRAATVQDLPRLGLIERVILEAMRLYPAAWIVGREAVRDCRIGDYAVPAGTTLCMSPWVIHRDPRHFDSPESFRPDRWSGDLGARLPRFAYLPFGGGPRICIGNRFAMMQAKLILATLLQRFRLEGQRDRPAVPQAAMSLRAKGGVWVRLSAR
jgi:cytochrome P450